jgi:hypothetical protein
MERNNVIIQVGWRGTGKTEFCKRIIQHRLERLVIKGKPNRCLVIDADNEYQYLPTLDTFEDFFFEHEDQEGTYRINFGDYLKEERKDIYKKAIRKFKNGLLICEDPSKYFFNDSGILDHDFVGMIVTARTFRIDVIVNFKLWKYALHPKLIANADMLIVREENITSLEKYRNRVWTVLFHRILIAQENLRTLPLDYVTINMHEDMSDSLPLEKKNDEKNN